jgi:hypothetical protein
MRDQAMQTLIEPHQLDVRVHVARYLQLDGRLAKLTELVQDLHNELSNQKALNAALRLDVRDHVCRAELHAAMIGKATSSEVNQLKIKVSELCEAAKSDTARPSAVLRVRAPSITVGSAKAQPFARRNAVPQLSENAMLILTLRREMNAANEAQAQMAQQLQTVLDFMRQQSGSTRDDSQGAVAQPSSVCEAKSGILSVSDSDSSIEPVCSSAVPDSTCSSTDIQQQLQHEIEQLKVQLQEQVAVQYT